MAIDGHGVVPEALAAACQRHRPKAVYLTRTVHNPSIATVTPARRREIADVIGKANVTLIEDDAYGQLDPDAVPIASLIPERSYLAASLSKCIVPGLRV